MRPEAALSYMHNYAPTYFASGVMANQAERFGNMRKELIKFFILAE